jgi:hypothetical protein
VDAAVVTTIASSVPDSGAAVAIVFGVLAVLGGAFGFPWWWGPACSLARAAWQGRRALADVKVEQAPEPISDGGAAEDRLIRPAPAPAPHYEVTDPLRPIEPGGGSTGGMS